MRKPSGFFGRFPTLSRSLNAPFYIGLLAILWASTGCSFDPAHDYAVTSTWLLNGSTPDAARCKELGISQFRLTMDGPGAATTLQTDCEEILRIGGVSSGGFETSVSFDYGVEYAYTVDALDAKGKVRYRYESAITAYYGDGDPVDLDTVDVFEPLGNTASFSAQWVFSDGDLAMDCERNKVKRVALLIASATDLTFIDYATLGEADCAVGIIESTSAVLARGDYYFQYVALDERGAVAELGEPFAANVDQAGNLALPRHQFEGL